MSEISGTPDHQLHQIITYKANGPLTLGHLRHVVEIFEGRTNYEDDTPITIDVWEDDEMSDDADVDDPKFKHFAIVGNY